MFILSQGNYLAKTIILLPASLRSQGDKHRRVSGLQFPAPSCDSEWPLKCWPVCLGH